jgi:hypothetical protein
MTEIAGTSPAMTLDETMPRRKARRQFCVCLKYFRSGGFWFFLAGIR